VEGLFTQVEELHGKIDRAKAGDDIMQKIAGLGGPGYVDDEDGRDGMFSGEQKDGVAGRSGSRGRSRSGPS